MSSMSRKKRNSMENHPQMSDVNIILLGSTGSGKSASGNTIIGGDRKTFEEDFSPKSVTRVCDSAQTVVDGQTITVIDTVGLYDTSVNITDAQTEIERMLQNTYDGVDVFLLVIKLSETFSEEKREAVKWIQENFGVKLLKHTIMLFTHGEQLHKDQPIEKYVSKCEALRSAADQCSGGYHVFNNKDEDRSQVTELLDKIKKLREKNGYRRYTEQDYAEIQKKLHLQKCAAGAAVGAAVGAAGGGVGVGGGALAVGLGAVGGAVLLAVAAGVGVFFLARKYKSPNINVPKKHKSV